MGKEKERSMIEDELGCGVVLVIVSFDVLGIVVVEMVF